MKLIDGEELLDRVNFILSMLKSTEFSWVFLQLKEYLENAPTFTLDDLRPKGRWERYPGPGFRRCTACRVEFDSTMFVALPNFCPHCGADMRGGGEDEYAT